MLIYLLTALFLASDLFGLKVGTSLSNPPFAYKRRSKPVGIEVEIIQEVAKHLGEEIEIIDTDRLIDRLNQGEIDIVMNALVIEENPYVLFTNPYLETNIALLVDRNQPRKKLGIKAQTTICKSIESQVCYTEAHMIDALADLTEGKIDGFIGLYPRLFFLKFATPSLQVIPYTEEKKKLTFALDRDAETLQSKINLVLLEMEEDGSIDAILKRWL